LGILISPSIYVISSKYLYLNLSADFKFGLGGIVSPEPFGLGILGIGAASLLGLRRRKRR